MELKATNWNDLDNIDAVADLSEDDLRCLEELRGVLERHNLTKRFGVALLHSHFPLEEDEVFLEHTDKEMRTLLSRPVRLSEMKNPNFRPTMWRFDTAENQGCSYCPTDAKGGHNGYKEPC